MKKFFAGLLVGAALMMGISAHAEVENLIGSVIEGQFPVKLNESQLEAQAIVVNGTSYLPVRVISEMLGLDVKFNADLGIELTSVNREDASVLEGVAEEMPETSNPAYDKKALIKSKIEMIEGQITAAESEIQAREKYSDDENLQKELAEWKSKLSDLEAEKAALEAQLAQLETP